GRLFSGAQPYYRRGRGRRGPGRRYRWGGRTSPCRPRCAHATSRVRGPATPSPRPTVPLPPRAPPPARRRATEGPAGPPHGSAAGPPHPPAPRTWWSLPRPAPGAAGAPAGAADPGAPRHGPAQTRCPESPIRPPLTLTLPPPQSRLRRRRPKTSRGVGGAVGGGDGARRGLPGAHAPDTRRPRGPARAAGPPHAVRAPSLRGGLRQRRELAGPLVVGEHADAPAVPLLAAVGRAEEELDEADRLLRAVHAGTDADHVGVVVLAGQDRGVLAPGQRGPDALDLVGGDLLAVAGAADHHAQGARVGGDALGGAQHEGRVVVDGVVDGRPGVHDLVPPLL